MDGTKTPRVLYGSNAYPPRFIGGAELIVEKHARALRSMGYEAAVFAGDGQAAWGPHYALQREDWNEVPVWRVQLACEDFAGNGVNFVNKAVEERFEEILDEFRPTVVHCHNLIGTSVQLVHLAKRRGLRTGLTLHDHWMYCPRNTLVTPEGKLCDPRFVCSCQSTVSDAGHRDLPIFLRAGMMQKIASEVDFFHFPSSYLRSVYIRWGLPPEKCHAIPNGIELDRFAEVRRSPSPGRVRITYVGYLGQHKGVEFLTETFAATPENSHLHLNIVGDGELREPLATRAREVGIADRVQFWGRVPNEQIREVYEQTDCLVLPSLWPENHPVSINEALACGIPVIASNSGGIPELVTHCKTGYLFEQGNRMELQRIFSHVARNADCLAVLSENARRDARRLSLQRTMHRMLRLYEFTTLADRPPRERPAESNMPDARTCATPARPARCRADRPVGPVHGKRTLTIACFAGASLDYTAFAVIQSIETTSLRSMVRLVLSDWLYETQYDDVDVFWLADRNLPVPTIVASRKNSLLLLPHDHCQAAEFADDPNAFLYSDAETALLVFQRLAVAAQADGEILASIGHRAARTNDPMPRVTCR